MTGNLDPDPRRDPSFKPLMRRLALEVAIYTPLVTAYLYIVLRFLKEPLLQLFQEMTVLYTLVSTLVIVGQGVLLAALTSWLIRRIGLR
jgi:hypothetical protein